MDEKNGGRRQKKKEKKGTPGIDSIDSICVLIAFIIIISASVGVVIFKNVFHPDFHKITFEPLLQQVCCKACLIRSLNYLIIR